MGILVELNREGDRTIEFNPVDERSVQAAKAVFDQFMQKNYIAYERTGETTGNQVREFNPHASEIVMSRPLVGG